MNAPSIAQDVTTVPVSLGNRSYDILIGKGLVDRAGEELAKRLKGVRVAVVTDENVAKAHLERLTASFAKAGVDVTPVIVAPGEKSKSFGTLETVTNAVLAARLERGDAVVAFGGGVVGDLSGFVAGIVRRGMNFVQMPTSLLSQVDSSVGGKTGVNTAHGKNLVGVFYQPQLVLADTEVLDTLSPREFRAGYAEVAKYGLIDRPDFSNGWNRTGRRSSPAARHGRKPSLNPAVARQPLLRATSAKPVTGRFSISAILSVTRWKRQRATIRPVLCMVKVWLSAWRWPIAFRSR